jgi:hypothetical protein
MGRMVMKSNNSIRLVQRDNNLEVTLDESQVNKHCVTRAILAEDFNFNPDLIAYTMLEAVKKMKKQSESIDLSTDKSFRKILGIKGF